MNEEPAKKGRKQKYTAAIIGCGRIGYSLGLDKKREQPASHTMALKNNRRIQIIAGCDKDENTLAVWKKANPKAITYTESSNLYARHKPDIIVVAVNEDSHKQEALEAIKALPQLLILEKPVALNVNDALDIKRTAERYNVPVLVNHERRFADDYHYAKQLLERIGTVQSIEASLFSGLRVYSQKEEKTGAYSLLHDGTHLIDIVLYFLEKNGKPSELIPITKEIPSSLSLAMSSRQKGGLLNFASSLKETNSLQKQYKVIHLNSLLRNPVISGIHKDEEEVVRNLSAHYSVKNGPSVTFNFSGRSEYFGFEIDIIGTRGRLCIGNGYLNLFEKEESKLYSGFYSLEPQNIKLPLRTNYFSNMVQNAVDFLDGKRDLESSIDNGINALAVIEEIVNCIRR